MTVALIIAGGVGSRMGADVPKQFVSVNGRPVLLYTLEAFERHPMVDAIEVVCVEGWEDSVLASAQAVRHFKAQRNRERRSNRAGVDSERRVCS